MSKNEKIAYVVAPLIILAILLLVYIGLDVNKSREQLKSDIFRSLVCKTGVGGQGVEKNNMNIACHKNEDCTEQARKDFCTPADIGVNECSGKAECVMGFCKIDCVGE